ncbi:hypothetical protein ACJRO7_012200 [Eucalyptus globulus]|uniref:non-specific serine/threonine protein kinase n=1 Tax=Eucalyptus globulus TaxID=34317 RepID=A0ABD3LHR6_EUCGL
MGLHCASAQEVICIALHIFFIAILEDHVESSSYEACEPRNCGTDDFHLSYPFYILGEESNLCGYPGFEITCQEKKATYGSYAVKSISYNESSIELVSPRDTSCFAPRPFPWLPDNAFLVDSVSRHFKLLFFYDCTDPSFPFNTFSVNCTSNATDNTSVALMFPNYKYPEENISNQTFKDLDYRELLHKGFQLKWDLSTSCTGCEKSGGRCGRSQDTNFQCYCPHGTIHPRDYYSGGGKLKAMSLRKKGALGASIGAFGVAIIVLAYLCQCKISKQKSMIIGNRKMKFQVNFENRGILVTTRYSYTDIKTMTNSFKEKLGEGGFGCVYKGKLPDGHLVAVKILSKLKGDGEDFMNEVNSMSRTSLGIAQGLEYLHKGCNSRILHFHIKPHNILLDENYCPKISDFGLAKICHREESTISLLGARGTAGFIAPEVFCRNVGGITQKSNVYTFGMIVLGLVGGRKNIVTGVERTGGIDFPCWIHKHL